MTSNEDYVHTMNYKGIQFNVVNLITNIREKILAFINKFHSGKTYFDFKLISVDVKNFKNIEKLNNKTLNTLLNLITYISSSSNTNITFS